MLYLYDLILLVNYCMAVPPIRYQVLRKAEPFLSHKKSYHETKPSQKKVTVKSIYNCEEVVKLISLINYIINLYF